MKTRGWKNCFSVLFRAQHTTAAAPTLVDFTPKPRPPPWLLDVSSPPDSSWESIGSRLEYLLSCHSAIQGHARGDIFKPAPCTIPLSSATYLLQNTLTTALPATYLDSHTTSGWECLTTHTLYFARGVEQRPDQLQAWGSGIPGQSGTSSSGSLRLLGMRRCTHFSFFRCYQLK